VADPWNVCLEAIDLGYHSVMCGIALPCYDTHAPGWIEMTWTDMSGVLACPNKRSSSGREPQRLGRKRLFGLV
jgi:hypothetical protein